MLLLSKCSFMTATHDFAEVSLEDIKEILQDSEDGREMVDILRHVKFDIDTTVDYEGKLKYYKALLEKITSNTVHKYTKEEKEICLTFLMGVRFMTDEAVQDLSNACIEKYKTKVDTLRDEIWFLFEKMRYGILRQYASGNKWDLSIVRELVASLKEKKSKYDELLANYNW